MLELFRDTSIGHLLRWLSGGKILPHAEDVDPSLWRMYISTEKSATLEHLVLEKNRRRKRTKGKRLQERTEKPTSAAGAENEKSEADQQATTVKPESDAVWKPAVATNKLPSPSQALKETGQQEEKPDSTSEIDKSPSPPGGNLGTAGTWNNDEIQQTYADDRSPQSWSNPDTPHNRSNAANTPLDTSSTELLWTAKDTGTTTTPENGKLDQGYVTAAMGQEGMDVSMQQGQVDGDPALLLHSENNETTWNTVQLEAGEQDGPTAKEGTAHAVDPAAERVVNVVVWLGPQDPGNPLNWSHAKKAFVTAQIYLLTVCTYIGTSIFSPGSHSVQEHFGVGEVKATLGTSLAILGYGLGVMIWSPMSEAIRIGRKPVYLVTLTVFVALQVPTVYAKNFGMLLAFRFLSGIFGAPVLAIGGASINDMYPPTQRGYAIIVWDVVSISAPGKRCSSTSGSLADRPIVLGPLLGGFAATAKGWQWTIWPLMCLSAACLVFFVAFMPETNSSNILYRRSRRLRVLTGNKTLKSEQDVLGGSMSMAETLQRLFARPFVLCFTEPILLVINIYIALLNAVLFGSLDSFPLVFNGIYGFNLGEVGLAFLGLFIGSTLSLPPMFYYLRYLVTPNDAGEVKPEKRLPPAMVGAFLVPISLFMFGWTARDGVHWVVPIFASGFFGMAIVTISYATLNYLPDAYPSCAASVLAGNECMRSMASAVFPLFTTAMYRRLGTGWASSLLGFLSCAFIPVPFVLYYYGHIIRSWSKRAKQDF